MTEQINADVIGLLIPLEANFMSSTKRGQSAATGDTKRLLLHNKSADTLDLAISDDSLQCLLAGTAPITGAKTFTQNLTVEKGSGAAQILIKGASSSAATLMIYPDAGSTSAKNWHLIADNSGVLEIGNDSIGAALNFTSAGLATFAKNLKVKASSGTSTFTVEGSAGASTTLYLNPDQGDTAVNNASFFVGGGSFTINFGSTTPLQFDTAGASLFNHDVTLAKDLIFGDIKLDYTHSGSGGTEVNILDVVLDSDYQASFRVKSNDTGLVSLEVAMDGVTTIGNATNYAGFVCYGRGIFENNDTSANPVLLLVQYDVSEEMIEFDCVIGTGNGIEAVGAKSLTTTHFIKIKLPGGLDRYIPVGTIT